MKLEKVTYRRLVSSDNPNRGVYKKGPTKTDLMKFENEAVELTAFVEEGETSLEVYNALRKTAEMILTIYDG